VKSSVEALEGNKVKVYVEVDGTEFESAVDAAFRKIAKEVSIPGFRRGKAPRRVLEAHLGQGMARNQALQDALPGYYSDAVREHDVDVIASPQIDVTDGELEGDIAFEAIVEIRPIITIEGYGGLKVTVPAPAATDEDVEGQLDRLRSSHSELVEVDRAAATDDIAVIDIEGTVDGEPVPGLTASEYSYPVGSAGIVPEVDEQLVGASAGDVLEFTAAHPVQEDTELEFRIEVSQIKERVLPELTDEFIAEATEFETLEAMRDDIIARMTESRRSQAQVALRERTGQALAGLVTEEIPAALVTAELQERVQDLSMRLQAQGMNIDMWLAMQGKTAEDFIEELRVMAEIAAKVDLALRAVAVVELIEATEDDLTEELVQVSERVGATPDEVRAQIELGGQLSAVRSDITKRKAFELLLDRVQIVDEDGAPLERASFDTEPEEPEAESEAEEETE